MIAHYSVDGKPFNNVYLAWQHCIKTSSPVKFYLNDQAYDQLDWTQEPSETFDQLMTAHAYHLRNQYQHLVLSYSGGYDSHTIYDVFAKNRIHLDAIFVSASDQVPWFPTSVYNWLTQNHWDPHTKIILTDAGNLDENPLFKTDQNWIYQDTGTLIRYHSSSFWATHQRLLQEFNSETSWRLITGFEKPRLVYQNGRWYSRQLASVLEHCFGRPNFELFFLEPRLAIKQSHLVKHAVKRLIHNHKLPLYNGDWAEAKFGRDAMGMHNWNLACGRINELNPGVSFKQKTLSEKMTGVSDINVHGQWTDLESVSPTSSLLINDLKQDKLYAKTFLAGIYELYSEKTLVNYFKHNNLFKSDRQNMLYDLPNVWSKEYDVGA